MNRSNNLAHLFNYLDEKTVEQLCNTSKLATKLSRVLKGIPGIADKWIKIEDVDCWINRFPGVTHIKIKGYDERINDYIHLFRPSLTRLNLSYTYVTDVSSLGGVHTLNLSGCTNVTDVSMLTNVKIIR